MFNIIRNHNKRWQCDGIDGKITFWKKHSSHLNESCMQVQYFVLDLWEKKIGLYFLICRSIFQIILWKKLDCVQLSNIFYLLILCGCLRLRLYLSDVWIIVLTWTGTINWCDLINYFVYACINYIVMNTSLEWFV